MPLSTTDQRSSITCRHSHRPAPTPDLATRTGKRRHAARATTGHGGHGVADGCTDRVTQRCTQSRVRVQRHVVIARRALCFVARSALGPSTPIALRPVSRFLAKPLLGSRKMAHVIVRPRGSQRDHPGTTPPPWPDDCPENAGAILGQMGPMRHRAALAGPKTRYDPVGTHPATTTPGGTGTFASSRDSRARASPRTP
jgi:hypothetical protein